MALAFWSFGSRPSLYSLGAISLMRGKKFKQDSGTILGITMTGKHAGPLLKSGGWPPYRCLKASPLLCFTPGSKYISCSFLMVALRIALPGSDNGDAIALLGPCYHSDC